MRTSGTVLLEVIVAANGDVTAAKVHRSSKLRRLDRAAVRSAVSEWHFDTSECGATNRPSVSKVAVVYEAKAAETSVPMRVPGFSRQLVQSKRMGCDVSGAAEGDFVTSCVVATGANAPLIAGR
jgi:TonB family protein